MVLYLCFQCIFGGLYQLGVNKVPFVWGITAIPVVCLGPPSLSNVAQVDHIRLVEVDLLFLFVWLRCSCCVSGLLGISRLLRSHLCLAGAVFLGEVR